MTSIRLLIAMVVTFALVQPAANAFADDPVLEIIGELPIGKLSFVTGGAFGGTGTIHVLGREAEPFIGAHPQLIDHYKKILFCNHRPGGSALYARDLDTGTITEIDNDTLDSDSPALSPSGSKLLFVSWPEGRKSSQIYVCDPKGRNPRALTDGAYYNWSPQWSPDETKIVFETTRDGRRQIYVMDADGRNPINLSNEKKFSHAPSWSPDGTEIAYMSPNDDNRPTSIWVMKSDGSDKRNISRGTTRDSEPTWSPDSQWIAFTRTDTKESEPRAMNIWIMRRGGTDQRQITKNAAELSSYQPAWSE